jgi:hypothetical protein
MKRQIYGLLSLFLAGCAAGSSSSSSSTGSTTTTFQNPTNLQISAIAGAGTARDLVIGDFNGDAYPDIALLTDSGIYIYLSQSGSAWSTPTQIAATATANYRVGTLAGTSLVSFRDLNYLSFLTNNGSASFSESTLAGGGTTSPSSLAYAPSKTSSTSGFIFVAAGSSGVHFTTSRSGTTLGPSQTSVTSAITSPNVLKVLASDVDGDGYTDFALIPSISGAAIEFFKNTTDVSIANSASGSLTRQFSTSIQDAALVDMNGDSKLDLLLATSSGIECYTGSSSFSGFTINTTLTPSALSVPAANLVAADFTGDSKTDLFLTRSGSTAVFYTQTGSLTFSDITSTAFGSSLLSANTIKAYAADIDQNRSQDIVELKSDGSIAVHINNYKK